jgi:transcriptional regulator with XRE-family HTH domain
MDNTKTGAIIKQLRKDIGMTQKELADLLHITDKAVSKWERGLCAPDISLLEPLAKALHTTVIELIGGERMTHDRHSAALEESTKSVLDYSIKEIVSKTRRF